MAGHLLYVLLRAIIFSTLKRRQTAIATMQR